MQVSKGDIDQKATQGTPRLGAWRKVSRISLLSFPLAADANLCKIPSAAINPSALVSGVESCGSRKVVACTQLIQGPDRM